MKATWDNLDVIHRSNPEFVPIIEANADALADRLGIDIKVCTGPNWLHSVHAVEKFAFLVNNAGNKNVFESVQDRQADGMRIFDSRRENADIYKRCFLAYIDDIERFSSSAVEHTFALLHDKTVIAVGFSPYSSVDDVDWGFIHDFEYVVRNMMECISPLFKNVYDLMVLPGGKGLYFPNSSFSYLFIKKANLKKVKSTL